MSSYLTSRLFALAPLFISITHRSSFAQNKYPTYLYLHFVIPPLEKKQL